MHPAVRKLSKLKLKLTTGTKFNLIFEYFLDHFGENKDFIAASTPQHNETLAQMIGLSVGTMLKKSGAQPVEVMMRTVAEQQFYHGVLKMDEYLVPFFYFEDIDMGLLGVMKDANTMFARFRMQQVSPPPAPPKN